MLLYAALIGIVCHMKFVHYGYTDFDLAVHAQSVHGILHGRFQSSILGVPFLGNHMVLILFLLAPLYAVFSSPLLLLHMQTICLASGAWPIYRLARQELPTPWAIWLSLLYLVYPPLVLMNLYEFHPIALASALLLWMLGPIERSDSVGT